MTLPGGGQPIRIGTRDVRLTFWGMPRHPGDPKRVEGTFTLKGPEGDLVLDAFIGPKGDPGEPMAPWDIQWDSDVASIGDLPNVNTLDETDDGRAWIIGTTLYVYVDALGDNGEYRDIDAGIPGPKGDTPLIDITAELVEADDPDDPYGVVNVVPYGTTDSPGFKLEIPGLRGPQGPSTAIRLAPDYDNTVPPAAGQGIVWDDEAEKYKPGDLSPTAATMWTIPHSAFLEYSGGNPRQLIATIDLPALNYAWYPDVIGHVRWRRLLGSSAQVEIEVRIGDTGVGDGSTAPLCGLAPYDPSTLDAITIAHIMPHFSDEGDPSRAITPDSSVGRVPVGQSKTIYVFTHKIGGLFGYEFTKDTAQLRVNQVPVS